MECCLLWSVVVVGVVCFFILKINVLNHIFCEVIRKLYAWDTSRLQRKFACLPEVVEAKKKLFGSMNDVLNVVDGPILELGAGSGANLEFYPEGTILITVDLNEHFRTYLESNLKTHSNVTLDKYLIGDVADMTHIVANSSCSCVVSTLLLCCTDQTKALQEIYRVLKPGGRFYFMEHIIEEKGTWMRWIQETFCEIWKVARSNCDITRETDKVIQNFQGFENLNAYIFYRPIDWQYSHCKRTYIGYVDKPAVT